MKKAIALLLTLLLAAALFTGCADKAPVKETDKPTAAPTEPSAETPTEEPTEPIPDDVFRFTRENFPRMDGSTACVPLGQALASVLLGESREDVADLVQFNRTTQSFRNLMAGQADILISGEPNKAVFDEMEEQGFEADIEIFGRDALIFVVNENNPVDNLTTQQIQDIYAGKITNWKEVGGEDAPIVAIQRNEGAGSQALIKKLIMKDVPMMEAPADLVAGEMGTLMTAVKSYDGSANAIGYSVYYYAHDMEMAKGLKLLKVDGVEPCKQTIRDETYPHLNAYYCVIAHSTPEDSPIRYLYNFIMSEEGQRLMDSEGYVSVMAFDD